MPDIEIRKALSIVSKPRNKAITRLPMSARQSLCRSLEAICVRAARIIGYLEARGVSGCGDGGHADGVTESNRVAAKVRKALGFTYPKDDWRF